MSIVDEGAADIAIIGMACRFPGAENPREFWHNIRNGIESITFFTDEELLAAGVEPGLLQDPRYVKAAPLLKDVEFFDASFFECSPKEAAFMDPQHRFFLEVAWEAFEDAGYDPAIQDVTSGVFAGMGSVITSYLLAHADHPDLPGQTASLQHISNDKDFLSTRVSYKLNLRGPSVTLQTACSTSLVAVHLGCQSLRCGECDLALAGASTIRIPQIRGYLAEKGSVHSSDGRCRAFDADGRGTIFGSGVAAVLLKRMDAAVADGDHVYAAIRGSAVNNDGADKDSYAGPSVAGQASAMARAITAAGLSAETIGYVECHATGTSIGDPLEIGALTRSFDTCKTQYCAIGSVKTNIGHAEQTAGLSGLMKVALALEHREIPPSLNFKTPNPEIPFAASPFYVNRELRAWPSNGVPRRGAVNSLGIGGTNAFVVLEEAPAVDEPAPAVERPRHLLALSAKSEPALQARVEQFRDLLAAQGDLRLADLCFSVNSSRSRFAHRVAVTGTSAEELRRRLTEVAGGKAPDDVTSFAEPSPVVFLFSGQGAQYPRMGAELYRSHPVFRETLEHCHETLRPLMDVSLLDVVFNDDPAATLLDETLYTQPALFSIEIALARLWESLGVSPGAAMGHSLGELTAACVAGVFELEDALELVARRAELMQRQVPEGSMATIFAGESAVAEVLERESSGAVISAVNSPKNVTVSGLAGDVERLCRRFREAGISTQKLRVSRAFHSPLMEPILDAVEDAASRLQARAPRLPLISNLDGRPFEDAPTPRYWRDHARRPVQFKAGMRTLRADGYRVFLEIGPGATSLALGRECLPDRDVLWLASLHRRKGDWAPLLESVRRLYLDGRSLDWQGLEAGCRRRRLSLPTYPFQRRRFWLASPNGDGASRSGLPVSRPAASPERSPAPARPATSPRPEAVEKELDVGLDLDRELGDHRIHGLAVLPTAWIVQWLLDAGRERFGGLDLQIEGFLYQQALILPEEGHRRVKMVLTPQDSTGALFRILGLDEDSAAAWSEHARGYLRVAADETAPSAPPDLREAAIHDRFPDSLPPARFYRRITRLGLDYGPHFQRVEEIHAGEGEVLTRVAMPDGDDGSTVLPAAFLDACLHVYPVLLGSTRGDGPPEAEESYLPIRFDRFRLHGRPNGSAWVHAVLRPRQADAERPGLDLRLYDDSGAPVAVLEGLELDPRPQERLRRRGAEAVDGLLYRLRWREADRLRPPESGPPESVADVPGTWLILADRGGLGEALAAALRDRGHRCHRVVPGTGFEALGADRWTVDPASPEQLERLLESVSEAQDLPWRGTLFLWGLDVTPMAELTSESLQAAQDTYLCGAFHWARAFAVERRLGACRMWFLTRAAQRIGDAGEPVEAVASTLWGLGRTLALEHPRVWGGLIDLAPGTDVDSAAGEVLAELFEESGEDQVAFRQGKRFVPRLVPGSLADSATAVRFRPDATYLITGGLGMLGLRISRWLVTEHGVRHLVLTRRSARRESSRAIVEELAESGAEVRVIESDVSSMAGTRALLHEIDRHMPPLRGVFHCAGVLADAILAHMSWDDFARGLAPKLWGGWNLHQATLGRDLDCFVLQSSLLSLTGSGGQANYTAGNAFLDALAAHRRASGLPAIAIQWGPWAEAGMATFSGRRGEATWRSLGIGYIPPSLGIRVLDRLIRAGFETTAVTLIDWARYLRRFDEVPGFYTDLADGLDTKAAASGAAASDTAASDTVASGTPLFRGDREARLDVIREQVMRELEIEDWIDPRQPLSQLGLDSLIAVNLTNRLEARLGIRIELAQVVRGRSLNELTDTLFPDLAGRGGDDSGTGEVGETTETVTRGEGWLIFPKLSPAARVRLFCFPFAGGGATTYRPWAHYLDPSIELVAIESPGRGSRIHETALTRVGDMLDALIPAMEPYLDKPCCFFGHCLGGLNVFQVARHLIHRQKARIVHLFFSGSRPPHRIREGGEFEERLFEDLLKCPGFDPLRPVYHQSDEIVARFIRLFDIGASDEMLEQPELRKLLLPAIRADFEMADRFRFKAEDPWDIPITCFAGLNDPYVPRADVIGWSDYTCNELRIHLRKSAHFMVVDDREFIIDTINKTLAENLMREEHFSGTVAT